MWAGEEGVRRPYPSGRTVISLGLWCMSLVMWSDSGMNTRDRTETNMSVSYGTIFSQVGKTTAEQLTFVCNDCIQDSVRRLHNMYCWLKTIMIIHRKVRSTLDFRTIWVFTEAAVTALAWNDTALFTKQTLDRWAQHKSSAALVSDQCWAKYLLVLPKTSWPLAAGCSGMINIQWPQTYWHLRHS